MEALWSGHRGGGPARMTFTATHTRALLGSDIMVTVSAGDKESIAEVSVLLDGAVLEELELADGTDDYSRSFSHVGESSPGMDHKLIVSATDDKGATHGATTEWSDG